MVEAVRRAAVLPVLFAAACGGPETKAPAPGLAPLRVVELVNPAGPGSGEASLAAVGAGKAILSWIEPEGDKEHSLRMSLFEEGRFGEPRTVARGEGFLVNWADFPTVTALGETTLFAHWLERSAAARYAYEVKLSRSLDLGRTWSEAVVPHADRSPVEHGFVSMADDGAGRLGLVWLDGRAKTQTALLSARVDAEGTVSAEMPVDERVCDCCQTALVRTPHGLLAAYRDRNEGEVRDIAVARFAGGLWTPGGVVADDRWRIDGCPVNGPALAAEGDVVALAWFTMEPAPRVRLALSKDGARSWEAPLEVHDGRPLGRVDVAVLPKGEVVVSFLEQARSPRPKTGNANEEEAPPARLVLRVVEADGRLGPALEAAPTTGARSSGFPRLERLGDGLLLAWRDAAEPARLRTARVRAEGP